MARILTVGVDYTNSAYTSFSNPNGNNGWQPWNQLTASCPMDVDEIIFFAGVEYYQNTSLYELGVGAAGSEIVIAGPILASNYSNGTLNAPSCVVRFKVKIPAGQRLAWRVQMSNNNGLGNAGAMLINCGSGRADRIGIVDSYGSVLTTSSGTAVVGSSTANVKGAWTQLVASTTRYYSSIRLQTQVCPNTSAETSFLFDVGVGAAGSEQIVVPDLWNTTSGAGSFDYWNVSPEFPVNIPAGSRIAVRLQSTLQSASTRLGLLGAA